MVKPSSMLLILYFNFFWNNMAESARALFGQPTTLPSYILACNHLSCGSFNDMGYNVPSAQWAQVCRPCELHLRYLPVSVPLTW